tara:strand:- start:1930 stop:2112 length:183 start_codon:yes stop_codon:yes gene_type:complete
MKNEVVLGLCGTSVIAYLGWMGLTLVELKTAVALSHEATSGLLEVVRANNERIMELAKYH